MSSHLRQEEWRSCSGPNDFDDRQLDQSWVIKLLEKRQGMGQQNRPSAGMLKLGVENEIDRFLNAWVRMMPFQKSIIFCWKTSEAKAMAAADAWMELECEYKEQMKKEKSLLIIFDSL